MYQLIICDDEKTIREGLCTIIQWNALGFEVCGAFEDGADALAFAKTHVVDAVLTDIRMYDVSGLTLIQGIKQINPDVMVAILTGYKEFEYAQKAISLGIHAFLVKPINFTELNTVFQEMKVILDSRKSERLQFSQQEKMHEETLPLLRQQFFGEFLDGLFITTQELERRGKICSLPVGFADKGVALASLHFPELEAFLSTQWQFGQDWFHTTLAHVFDTDAKNHWEIGVVHQKKSDSVRVIFVNLQAQEEDEIRSFIQKKLIDVQSLIGVNGTATNVISYENAASFLQCQKQQRAEIEQNAQSGSDAIYNSIKPTLQSSLHENDIEMLQVVVERLFGAAVSLDVMIMIAQRLIRSMMDEFEQFKIGLSDKQTVLRLFYDMSTAVEVEAVKELFLSLCKEIAQKIMEVDIIENNNMIDIVKKYIKANYAKDLTLDEVAAKVFLSPAYCSFLFHQETGNTYSEYLTKVRMEQAKALLAVPEHRISDVCEKSGYNNVKYFTTCFKKYAGMTPTEYRQKIASKALAE